MLRAFGYGDIATSREGEDFQGVVESHIGGDVSGDDADALHVEFGRIQGEQYCQGVVGTGIRVDHNFLGSGVSKRHRGRNADAD